jgi:hypothetical protein
MGGTAQIPPLPMTPFLLDTLKLFLVVGAVLAAPFIVSALWGGDDEPNDRA